MSRDDVVQSAKWKYKIRKHYESRAVFTWLN